MLNEEDKERLALILTGPSILLGLLGGSSAWIMAKGHEATAWLINHHILVPREKALITFLDAGLDLARIILIAAVTFLIIWGAIASARRKHVRG